MCFVSLVLQAFWNPTEIMKCALRFEKLILERRRTESCKDQNDQELLQDIVSRYNGYKATAALKRWQIGPDMMSAILAVICGMCAEARQLVRLHLDFNKFDESGCLNVVVGLPFCFRKT